MSLKVEDNEGASSEKTCYISVSAINDAPVITAPSSFSTEEDRAVALKGISVEDVDIEEIRGVSVSSPILRVLEARGWIEAIGHRDVPGRPVLFATTEDFLNDLNLSLKYLSSQVIAPASPNAPKFFVG